MIKLSVFIIALLCSKAENPVDSRVLTYIETYKYIAIDEMVRTGIPASITMAQAIVESNAGISTLARESNNHFGIKCKNYWEGDAYYHPDDDRDANGKLIASCFRSYDSVTESYIDHSNFLSVTEHYQPLFVYDKTEYELWAGGLELCGYATDDAYAEKLIRTIELYDLHELDYYEIQYVERSSLIPKTDMGSPTE